jgi:hypothetical protein
MQPTCASPRLRQSLAALGFGYGLNEEEEDGELLAGFADDDRAGLALGRAIEVEERVASWLAEFPDGVDRASRIGSFVVGDREELVVLKCEDAGDHFDHSTAGAEISHLALGGDDWDIAEPIADGLSFFAVAVNG